jgi:hypothetical protein
MDTWWSPAATRREVRLSLRADPLFVVVVADLPTDEAEAASLIGNGSDKIVGGSKKYVLGRFNALREFYRGASQRQLLVVLWWD